MIPTHHTNQLKRQRRNRLKLKTKSHRPRLHVYRSNRHLYAQVIDDRLQKTLCAATEAEITAPAKATKLQRSALLGTLVAQKAKKVKVTQVKFDRGSYQFHGRVKALAQAARTAGLEF